MNASTSAGIPSERIEPWEAVACHQAGRIVGYEQGSAFRRETDAACVEKAGCVCAQLHRAWIDEQEGPKPHILLFTGRFEAGDGLVRHDHRCPIALAASIQAKK